MGKTRVGSLGVIVAVLALAQRLAQYENRPLAIALAAIATAAFVWLIVLWIRDGIAWRRERQRLKRDEAERRPKKMGYAEALALEDKSIATIQAGIPELARIVSGGVRRQEEIKAKQAGLNLHQPGVRQRFNQTWVDHARNIRKTAGQLRIAIQPMVAAARTWKECQERIMDWQHQNQGSRPPDKWITGRQTLVTFRETVRSLATTFANSESRWAPEVREMHRDLDAAVSEHGVVSQQVVAFSREMEAMCTVMIDAVDQWNRRGWIRRLKSWFSR
jgi:hypothetical protein